VRKFITLIWGAVVATAALAVLALPAGAQGAYPPVSTTPTSAPAPPPIAFTGSESTPLLLVGLVAVTLGAVLVVAARRLSATRAARLG
jgi:hypothetical protein